jgi:Flp pilus assembly protein TadG
MSAALGFALRAGSMRVSAKAHQRLSLIIRRLAADQGGSITIVAAVMLVALMGMGAIVVDLSHSWNIQARLQGTADASSLGGAQMLPDTAAATAKALDLATRNVPSNYGTVLASSDVVFGNYDPTSSAWTANGSPTNAVRVVTSRTAAKGNAAPRFFAGVLGLNSADIVTSALAYRPSSAPPSCVFVLDSGNSNGALSVGGGGSFKVPNCGVWVNSNHPSSAASSSGASTVVAKGFCIVGGYSGTFTATPITGCAVAADPLASVPEPAVPSGGCKSLAQVASSSWTPGLYCGAITMPANATLAPGLYYFQSATIDVSSGQNITASGVTLFLDRNSTLNHNNGGTLSLAAPTTGTLKGIVLFQSRLANLNNQIRLTGNASFTLDGTVYLPRAKLQLGGNASVSVVSKVGYVIAYQLGYTGASTFEVGTTGGVQALGSFIPPILTQ